MAVTVDVKDVLGAAVAIAWCESCFVHLANVEFAETPQDALVAAIEGVAVWQPRSDGLLVLISEVAMPGEFFGWVCVDCHKLVLETELFCEVCFKKRRMADPVTASRARGQRRAKAKKQTCRQCGGASWKINRFGDATCNPCSTLVSTVVASRS